MSCVDVIVVKQADGSLKSSPFFIRFNQKATRSQLVRIYLDGKRFIPSMKHETQLVLDANDQYCQFRKWKLLKRKKHSGVFNKEMYYMANSNNDQEKNNSIDLRESTANLSDVDYLKEKEIENLMESNSCETSKSFELAIKAGLLDEIESDGLGPNIDNISLKENHMISFNSKNQTSNSKITNKEETNNSSIYYTREFTRTNHVQKGFFDSWLESIDRQVHAYNMLVPTSKYLKEMNLQHEITKITYELNGEKAEGRIFLWNHSDKLVVSDVDGTITKSDILGQIYTRLGKDYTHPGIPSLFTKIVTRGYRIIYLTARPIIDSQMTRMYIENINQDGYLMPLGPVITTPYTTWSAIACELIIRKPQAFKISILSFIKTLFDENPFVAGFGNRLSDCESYAAVGIDPDKSFRVNPKGEVVVHSNKTFFPSHKHIEKRIDELGLFPFCVELPPIPSHLLAKKNELIVE